MIIFFQQYHHVVVVKGDEIMGFVPKFHDNSGGFAKFLMIYNGITVDLLQQSTQMAGVIQLLLKVYILMVHLKKLKKKE